MLWVEFSCLPINKSSCFLMFFFYLLLSCPSCVFVCVFVAGMSPTSYKRVPDVLCHIFMPNGCFNSVLVLSKQGLFSPRLSLNFWQPSSVSLVSRIQALFCLLLYLVGKVASLSSLGVLV